MTVLPTVREQIVEAARREASGFRLRRTIPWPARLGRSPGVWRRRIAVWPLVLALSVGVTVAIAVGALVLVHRSGQGQASASQMRGLIARLAVLRRPQRLSDKLPACCHPQSSLDGAIIPRLTRLVGILPGARFYLVVTQPATPPKPLWSSKLGDQVAIVEIARGFVAETLGIPAADLSDPSQVHLFGPVELSSSSPHLHRPRLHPYNVEVVPDGVARVRWDFRDLNGGPDRLVSLRAKNNVVVAPASRRADPLLLQHVTWYRPDGTLAPTSFAALRQAQAAQDAPQRARELRYDLQHSYPAPPGLLAHFSIFKIDSRTGVKVAPGMTILHPRLSSLPWGILTDSYPGPNMDPQQLREVITPSGILLVVPGQQGLCIALIRPQPLTGLIQGGGSACTGAGLAQAETQGVSATSGGLGQSATYGIVPDSQRTVTIRPGGRHMGVQMGPTKKHTIRPIYGTYIFRSFARQITSPRAP